MWFPFHAQAVLAIIATGIVIGAGTFQGQDGFLQDVEMNGQVTHGLPSSNKKHDMVVLELGNVVSHVEALYLLLVNAMTMPATMTITQTQGNDHDHA